MNNLININKKDPGYILAFTLIIMAILLIISLSVARIIIREVSYSRFIENGKSAYFAADSGLECAEYLDSNFKDDSVGASLIINSSLSTGPNSGKNDFENNMLENIFFSTSTVYTSHTNISNTDSISNIEKKIFCSSDGSYNQIFNVDVNNGGTNYASSISEVEQNLIDLKSSYNIVGDNSNATTTFGLIIKQLDADNNEVNRCALVVFAKTRFSDATNTTTYFSVSSTGYSTCNGNQNSKVSRTLYRYSTD